MLRNARDMAAWPIEISWASHFDHVDHIFYVKFKATDTTLIFAYFPRRGLSPEPKSAFQHLGLISFYTHMDAHAHPPSITARAKYNKKAHQLVVQCETRRHYSQSDCRYLPPFGRNLYGDFGGYPIWGIGAIGRLCCSIIGLMTLGVYGVGAK